MTAQTKEILKGYFLDGKVPNQSNYADLIDSYVDVLNSDVDMLDGYHQTAFIFTDGSRAFSGPLNAPLIVKGVSDTVQLVARANATQTAHLQDWQKSDNTVLAFMTGLGYLSLGTASPSCKLDLTTPLTADNPSLGSELIATGWTTTGWTGDFVSGFTHTVGNTDVLSNSYSPTVSSKYYISFTVTGRTAGSFNLSFGGVSFTTITVSNNYGIIALTTGNLTITPTSDFNGTIIISIKSVGNSAEAAIFRNSTNTNQFHLRISGGGTFFGYSSGLVNFIYSNTGFGRYVLSAVMTGSENNGFGYQSMYSLTTGQGNNAFGTQALKEAVGAKYNTVVGGYALSHLVNTNGNVAIGYSAGNLLSNGSNNVDSAQSIYIGYDARPSAASAANEIAIGYSVRGNGNNTVTLGADNIVKTYLKGLVSTPAGLLTGANSFPASPVTGQEYFRADLGWWCYYDGSRWLTVHEFCNSIPFTTLSANTVIYFASIRNDYRPYFTRVTLHYRVATLNDATTNYWIFDTMGWDTTIGTAAWIDQSNTTGVSASVWGKKDTVPNQSSLPAQYSVVSIYPHKTGNPGNLEVFGNIYYRLVII